MVLNKKVKRTILENKSRYLGSFLLILLSCMLYTGFNISGPSVKHTVDEFRKDNKMEDASFIMQKPIDNVTELEREYNILLESRKTLDYKYDDDKTIRILGATEKVNKYSITNGNALKNSGDLLIDREFAKANKLECGSKIKIYQGEYVITGFFSTPDYTYILKTENDMVVNHNAFGVALISKEDFSNIPEGYSYYMVKFNEENAAQFKEEISKNNIIVKWQNADEITRITTIDGDADSFVQVGSLVPFIILIITCVMVSVFIWRLLRDEFVQLGTLYALGYKKSVLLRYYLSYPFVLAICGGILGTIAGVFFSKVLMSVFIYKYNLPQLSGHNIYSTLFVSIILPFIFLIPVTYIVIHKALKRPALELIKNSGNKVKVGFIERRLKLQFFNFNIRFRIKDMVRNLQMKGLIFVGIAFASLLLLFGFAANDSINYMFTSMVDTYTNEFDYKFNSIQTMAPEYGEIESFSPVIAKDKNGKEITFIAYGIDKNAKLVKFKDLDSNPVRLDNTVISAPLAAKLGLNEGDILNAKNKLSLKELPIKIDKLVEDYNNYVYMPIDIFNKLNDYPQGSYMGILSDKRLEIDDSKLVSVLVAKDQKEGFKTYMELEKVMLGILGLISFMIGLILIYVITTLSIESNKQSISLMKILGYGDKKIGSLILGTNNFIVILGYFVSVPLILVLMGKLFEVIGSQMNVNIPSRISNINIFICFVFMFFTYKFSESLCKRKLARISMADSLKNRGE